MDCEECRQRLYPDDPRMKSGRYNLCGCDYCNKPTYLRDIKAIEFPQREVIMQDLRPIKAEVNYLLNKINTLDDASKKRVDKENYEPF